MARQVKRYGVTLHRKAELVMTRYDTYVDLTYEVVTPDGSHPVAYFSPNRCGEALTNEFIRYLRHRYAPITADEVRQAFMPEKGTYPWDIVQKALKQVGGDVDFPFAGESFPHYVLRVGPPTRAVVRTAHRAVMEWLRDSLARCEEIVAERGDFQSWLRKDWRMEV